MDTILSSDEQVCLISAQPMPNYIGAMKAGTRIRKAHFVTTPAMQAEAAQLGRIFARNGIAVEKHHLADTTPAAIFDLLEGIHFDARPDVNVTGGNKIMALTATEWANMNEYVPFYVDTENSRMLIMRDRFESIPLQMNLSVREIIEVHGHHCSDADGPAAGPTPDRDVLGELAAYAVGHPDQLALANLDINKAARTGSLSCDLSAPAKEEDLFRIFEKAGKAGLASGRAIFPDAAARDWCNGVWLEHYVHAVLYKMRMDRKLDDWSKSFTFYSDEEDAGKAANPYYKQRGFKNEFDAAFTWSGRLAVIECKTISMPRQGTNQSAPANKVTDISYKLDALTKKSGGTFAMGLLVSVNDVPERDRKRLEDAGHRLITGRKLLNLNDELSGLIQ